jgi:acyl-coenzyme A synthetase/AMP-(fatty) acid ligase
MDRDLVGRHLPDPVGAASREIVRHCARFLEDYMVPKFVEFRPSLPKTESGKISRRLVAESQPEASP